VSTDDRTLLTAVFYARKSNEDGGDSIDQQRITEE
jgi:hypothetical protein